MQTTVGSFRHDTDTALKLAKDVFKPLFTEMDRNAPEYVNGEVKVHPDMKKVMREAGEGGWISATFPYEVGGSSCRR